MSGSLPPLVAPFKGERYSAVEWSEVLAPPYDVISPAERSQWAARSAYNVVHAILPDGAGDRYQRAADILEEWRRRGVLAADRDEGLYVLRQRFTLGSAGRYQRTGLLAAVLAEGFGPGRVKPHERTHAAAKADRLALLRATRTMCEALLMLCRDPAGLLRRHLAAVAGSEPLAVADLAGVELTLWRIEGTAARPLAEAAGADGLYIADGHHRYETATTYRAENPAATHTLALIVPVTDPGLVVLPTHRLLVGSPVATRALEHLSQHFRVEALPPGADPLVALRGSRADGSFLLVLPEGAYVLLRRERSAPPDLAGLAPVVRNLDVAWADHLIVPALQRAAGRMTLEYSPDASAALRAVGSGQAQAAVLLRPPAVEDVLAVADAGAFMPPKATYFAPKVPSGLAFLRYPAP
jgi:uncharacterized protein (DUF1015 family)